MGARNKVDTTASGGSIIYVFLLDPPVKNLSYHPTSVLYETGAFSREEADAIFAKLKDSYQQINPWPLQKVGDR